jgi:hypothetical protein
VRKGSRISVGDHYVDVKAMVPPNLVVIMVDDGPEMVISDQSKTDILPTVSVFSGVGAAESGNRLAFEAPRSVTIRRLP